MQLTVQPQQRYAKMRAHTAAHLLHAELVKIFPNTKQAGSFVDDDYLRFDFLAERALSQQEITQIQTNINEVIFRAIPVTTTECSFDEAVRNGAKAFFEDKYGDTVRMVVVAENVSIELCGGTHVTNTKDIGAFALVSQEAVASGTKRISAFVGPKVISLLNEKDELLNQLGGLLDVNQKQLLGKTEKIMKEYTDLKSAYESLETRITNQTLRTLTPTNKDGVNRYRLPQDCPIKTALFGAKEMFADQEYGFIGNDGAFAIISPSGKAKNIAQSLGIKGGGNDNLVQGKDPQTSKIL